MKSILHNFSISLSLLAVSGFLLVSLQEKACAHQEGIPSEDIAAVGLDEHLGAKIPLDITFRDERDKPVRLSQLITGPTIILPVYYNCTNVCNFLQSGLARVIPELKNQPVKDYRIISLSFDETETPALASRYQRTYLTAINRPFPEDGWRFLTGDSTAIHRLTDAAGYRFIRQGRDFIHPVASIVVAGDGTIVRYLYGTNFLPKDLSLALLEARQGRIGGSIRQMVGFCFTFDPQGKTYVFNLLRVSATVVFLTAASFLLFLIGTGRRKRPGHTDDPTERQ